MSREWELASRRRRSTQDGYDFPKDLEHRSDPHRRGSLCDRHCAAINNIHGDLADMPSESHQLSHGILPPRIRPVVSSPGCCLHHSEDVQTCEGCLQKMTLTAENEVEAHRSMLTCGNIFYLLFFGWWLFLLYTAVSLLMFLTVLGAPYDQGARILEGGIRWVLLSVFQLKTYRPDCQMKFSKNHVIAEVTVVKDTTPLLARQDSCKMGGCGYWLSGLCSLCCHHDRCIFLTHEPPDLLPLVIVTLTLGYADKHNYYTSSVTKFTLALLSIMPLSYYIGMAIASISAQSNFAVGAVVNATFGSITELTFYITALIKGAREKNRCYEEIVKSALTGTLLGCVLFIPGLCMVIGGIRHQEQRFNSRSAGISSALLFLSVGDGEQRDSVLQPYRVTAYFIGLIFTLKTHSHIYDIHISDCHMPGHHHSAVVHWSRWRAVVILLVATLGMSACADLATEHIGPILNNSPVSQYFIGVTVLAMVPEIPELINGIQFALQNNLSLSIEIGNCIAVQVCMLQIPILVLFTVFYPTDFILVFSDLHVYASMFSVVPCW
ncbi:hypothetical protein Chor_008184 [Crotalus horridus]